MGGDEEESCAGGRLVREGFPDEGDDLGKSLGDADAGFPEEPLFARGGADAALDEGAGVALGGGGLLGFHELARNHRDDGLGESARGDELGRALLAGGAGLPEHDDAFCLRVFLEEGQDVCKFGADEEVPADGDVGGLADAGAGEGEGDLGAHPAAAADDADGPGGEHEVWHLAAGAADFGLAGGEHPLAVGADDEGSGRPGAGENLGGVVVGHPLGEKVDPRNARLDGLNRRVPREAGRDEKNGEVHLVLF